MIEFPKPKLIVSRCLEFDSCRYNGQKIPNNFVSLLKDYVDFVPVCPEMEIGLGVPRDTIQIRKVNSDYDLYQSKTGLSLGRKMSQFSSEFISAQFDIDGAILKSKSPSCGIRGIHVYNQNGKTSEKRAGFFAAELHRQLPGIASEDEGRLNNAVIREHFLTKLYTIRLFKDIAMEKSINALVRFQAENKYLFMTYNQNQMRQLGRLIANHEKKKIAQVIDECEPVIHKILAQSPRRQSVVNVLM
ncbi:MAG: DUF1722 domain-containing protein, partial [Calditrichaeota bacterium]|nr:DUF1722 domain-containing protein [Calditrichota bacterium]